MMDDNTLAQMVEDKITVENLETIRAEERESPSAIEAAESKVLRCLQDGSLNFRGLRRKSNIKACRLNGILEGLESKGLITITIVKNRTGPATRLISLKKLTDNSPEARQRRINALGMGMYKSGDWS